MATSEEKAELVETLKGPRYYRVLLWGYGGEAAYINLDKAAYEFWNNHVEEHSDNDLVNYVLADQPDDYEFENLTDIPPEADFLRNVEEEYKYQWYEAEGEFCHQNGVEYGSARINVEEVDAGKYSAKPVASILDGQSVSELIDNIRKETEYEVELGDFGEPKEFVPQGDYVCQIYSTEKGTFFEGVFETIGNFDPKKLKFVVNEYPNGEEIIDSVEYDGVEIENDGSNTNGKGYSASMWSNI